MWIFGSKTQAPAEHVLDIEAKAAAIDRSQAVIEFQLDGTIITANQNFLSALGYSLPEIQGRNHSMFVDAEDARSPAYDAGRGFAVVASEVRALAQRSADAAKEIKALISTSSDQVRQGVELVARAGEALGRIASGVDEISSVVGEIAASAQEQSVSLVQVNTAVNQMDQMTQQNAAMVEQSTAASHALAREAEQLSAQVTRFELGVPRADIRKRPNPAPASSTRTEGPGRSTRPSGPSRGRAATALAQAPIAVSAWEEC